MQMRGYKRFETHLAHIFRASRLVECSTGQFYFSTIFPAILASQGSARLRESAYVLNERNLRMYMCRKMDNRSLSLAGNFRKIEHLLLDINNK